MCVYSLHDFLPCVRVSAVSNCYSLLAPPSLTFSNHAMSLKDINCTVITTMWRMCVRGLGEGVAGLGWLAALTFWDSLWRGAIINVVVTYTWAFPARTSQNLCRERRLFQTCPDPLTSAFPAHAVLGVDLSFYSCSTL